MDKFGSTIKKETIEYYYCEQKYTIPQMLPIIGCKSSITASKVLHGFGIDTNRNKIRALKNRKGMTEKEHKEYLNEEYIWKKRSLNSLAHEFGVTSTIIKRYLKKYGIPLRNKKQADSVYNESRPRRNITIQNGYIAYKNSTNSKYQHRAVVEQAMGRKLNKDEIVHHRDGDKLNNCADNLILLSNSEHAKLHALLRKGLSESDAEKKVMILWTSRK